MYVTSTITLSSIRDFIVFSSKNSRIGHKWTHTANKMKIAHSLNERTNAAASWTKNNGCSNKERNVCDSGGGVAAVIFIRLLFAHSIFTSLTLFERKGIRVLFCVTVLRFKLSQQNAPFTCNVLQLNGIRWAAFACVSAKFSHFHTTRIQTGTHSRTTIIIIIAEHGKSCYRNRKYSRARSQSHLHCNLICCCYYFAALFCATLSKRCCFDLTRNRVHVIGTRSLSLCVCLCEFDWFCVDKVIFRMP